MNTTVGLDFLTYRTPTLTEQPVKQYGSKSLASLPRITGLVIRF